MLSDSKKGIEVDGIVRECLPDTKFLVEIEVGTNKVSVTGYLSGKMRMHYIKILPGDRVTIEMTPYDLTKGRVVYRHK